MKNSKLIVYVVVALAIFVAGYVVLAKAADRAKPAEEKVSEFQDKLGSSTTTIKIKSGASGDKEIDTGSIEVLGIGDLKSNFDQAYGKAKKVDGDHEYSFIAGKLLVIYAPDIEQKERAWQLTIQQRPTSFKSAQELAKKFMPRDAKLVGSADLGIEAKEFHYKSETLAGLFDKDIFMTKTGSIDPGIFRLKYDIDDSNLVYRMQLLGGSFEF